MAAIGEDEPRPVQTHEIGQDLSRLSVHELEARIALLRAEIERLEAAKSAKAAHLAAADSVFGKR
jgi:uncharacterized small protein (DUF1192 family)